MAGSEEDDDMEEIKATVKKAILRSSDDDDVSSSEDSEFSESKISSAALDTDVAGRHEEISLESDISNIMRLQKQLQSLQRQLDREKSNKATVENKRTSLENDNKLLNQKIETLNKDKRSLEQLKIELEAKLRSLQMSLTEEHERRKNAEMMANRAKDQLARNDEQCKTETAAKQKCELMIRTLQVQLQNADDAVQQLEKEKNEFQQKAFESQSALIVAQSPRETLKKKDEFQSQLTLEKEKTEAKENIELLSKENKALQQMLDNLRNDLKLDEDTLAKTTLQFSVELEELKSENSKLKSRIAELDRDILELERLKLSLSKAHSDLEKTELIKCELERSLQIETDKLKDTLKSQEKQFDDEKAEKKMQSIKLQDFELMLGKSKRELEAANRALEAKVKELSVVHEELKNHKLSQDKLGDLNREQKEEIIRLQVKLESLQNKVSKLQDEVSKLNQFLDDEKQKFKCSEELGLILNERKSDQEKALKEIQCKNDLLGEKVDELKHKLELTEHRKVTLEKDLENTRERLAEAHQQILSKKMALDVDDQLKSELQAERDQLMKKLDRLGKEFEETKVSLSNSERHAAELIAQLQNTTEELNDSKKALKTKQEELNFATRQIEQNNAKLKDVADEAKAQNQEKGRVLFGDKPNVTDYDKSGSNQRKTSGDVQSDILYSSDELTSAGQHGKLQRKSNLGYDSKSHMRSRSRSETDLRNPALEKEVAKLKGQLRLAKKQLKSDVPQRRMECPNPMEHMHRQPQLPNSKLGTIDSSDQLAEIEARIRMDLNAKLAAVNQYLQEHADTCEKIDVVRDRSSRAIRSEFSILEKELQEELRRLKETQTIAVSTKIMKEVDQEPLQLKDLYDSGTSSINRANHPVQPEFDNITTDHILTNINTRRNDLITTWPCRASLSGLPFNIKQQLDRSIAKHLEKAPQLNILSVHQDKGVTVAAMLDRSAHDYASVLKRTYLIA